MDRFSYLGYLARTVPPHRLAQVAAVRLWRGARRTLETGPQLPTEAEILRGFGGHGLSALPRRVAAPVRGAWGFASPPAVASTARALRSRMPDAAAAALELAEAALERRVSIFGRPALLREAAREIPLASAGWRAIDWEVDPLSGARFDRGEVLPPADIKYPWVPGRLEETVHLACGAALAAGQPVRSRAFGDAAIDRMLDFAAAPRGVQWSCAMEVALRAANIAIALRLLAGHAALEERPAALLEVLRSLAFHLRWVSAHLEDTVAVPNNHLVADLVGQAVVGSLLPRLAGAAGFSRSALRQLERELLAQTLSDGFTFEGSVPYHRLAVELFLLADLAAGAMAAPFGAAARERLVAMFDAIRELGDGRGLAPQIGDNDSGRALPFGPRDPQELAYLLPIGAALFGRQELNLQAPSAESIWLLGLPGLRRLDRMPRGRPPRDSALPQAGLYLLRSRRLSCAIACGPNGTGGTGTHGHNDKLAVEICVDGELVVGDPGSGSYTGDPILRNRLRGTAAHSTVQVDGEEQQRLPEGRLFALPESAHARCLGFSSDRARARFDGEHLGYGRLEPAVVHRRAIVLDRLHDGLIIRDDLLGSGACRAQARFLLPRGEARIRPLCPEERASLRRTLRQLVPQEYLQANAGEPGASVPLLGLPRAIRWDTAHAIEIGRPDAPLAVLVGAGAAGTPTLDEAVYAHGYGEVMHALHACFRLEGTLPTIFTAVLLPLGGAAGR